MCWRVEGRRQIRRSLGAPMGSKVIPVVAQAADPSSLVTIRQVENLGVRLLFCTLCRFAAVAGTSPLHRLAPGRAALREVYLFCSLA